MREVFEALEQELTRRVSAAARDARSASEALQQCLSAFFDACMEDDIRAIVFEQAPRVLGWKEWWEIDARYGLGLVRDLLSGLRRERETVKCDDNIVASLFLWAAVEAGMQIAAKRSDKRLRRECEKVLTAFVDGLSRSSLKLK